MIKRPWLTLLLTFCWVLLGTSNFLAAANPVAEAHTILLHSIWKVARDPAILQLLTLIVTFLTVVGVSVYTYFTYKLLSTATHQAFENTFFQLLRFHHEIVNAIEKRVGPTAAVAPLTGRSAFPALYRDFLEYYRKEYTKNPQAAVAHFADEAYLSFYKNNQYRLGHYFRNLYHIIKFVDRSNVHPGEKDFCTHLVRAQLSSDELLLLFYNCHSSLGKEKFYPFIVKYALLENMSQDDLAGRQLKLPADDKSLYPPGAYGES